MTTTVLAPYLTSQFFGSNGAFLSGGQLFTYQAGTVTPTPTYLDSTGVTPNTNPIVLNARGECSIWVLPNAGYKFVLQDSSGNPIWTRDQVIQSQLLTLYGGVDGGIVNAYVLTFNASFTSYADGTVVYFLASNTNTSASTININGIGVVSITNPNGTPLSAGQIIANSMTEIIAKGGQFQLISIGGSVGVGIGTFGTEQTVGAAATTDLGTATAHVVNVTGNAAITSFGGSAQAAAPIYSVRFANTPTIIYNAASLITPNATNISVAAGDAMIAQYLGSGNWKILHYQTGLIYLLKASNLSDVANATTALSNIGGNNATNITAGTLNYARTGGTVSAAGNGYEIFPSGIIRQWGAALHTGASPITVTFPLAFTTTVYNLSATSIGAGSSFSVQTSSLTQFLITTAATTVDYYWEATGK